MVSLLFPASPNPNYCQQTSTLPMNHRTHPFYDCPQQMDEGNFLSHTHECKFEYLFQKMQRLEDECHQIVDDLAAVKEQLSAEREKEISDLVMSLLLKNEVSQHIKGIITEERIKGDLSEEDSRLSQLKSSLIEIQDQLSNIGMVVEQHESGISQLHTVFTAKAFESISQHEDNAVIEEVSKRFEGQLSELTDFIRNSNVASSQISPGTTSSSSVPQIGLTAKPEQISPSLVSACLFALFVASFSKVSTPRKMLYVGLVFSVAVFKPLLQQIVEPKELSEKRIIWFYIPQMVVFLVSLLLFFETLRGARVGHTWIRVFSNLVTTRLPTRDQPHITDPYANCPCVFKVRAQILLREKPRTLGSTAPATPNEAHTESNETTSVEKNASTLQFVIDSGRSEAAPATRTAPNEAATNKATPSPTQNAPIRDDTVTNEPFITTNESEIPPTRDPTATEPTVDITLDVNSAEGHNLTGTNSIKKAFRVFKTKVISTFSSIYFARFFDAGNLEYMYEPSCYCDPHHLCNDCPCVTRMNYYELTRGRNPDCLHEVPGPNLSEKET